MTFEEYIAENIKKYAPEYEGGNTNHFPMALFACKKIGGTEKEMKSFYDAYKVRLEPRELPDRIEKMATLQDFIGKKELYESCLFWISGEVEKNGVKHMLKEVLPQIVDGICSAAFHTMIRLAYAVEMNIVEEVNAALAYFITRADILTQLPGTKEELANDQTLFSILESVQANKKITYPKSGRFLFAKINDIAAQDTFKKFCSAHVPLHLNLGDISEVALYIYAHTKDFLSLHLMTSVHALRVLLPFIDAKEKACRALFIGHLAGYVAIQKPDIVSTISQDATKLKEWDELYKIARASNEEHTIKFIYTCFQESKYYNKRPYQYCASLRVGK